MLPGDYEGEILIRYRLGNLRAEVQDDLRLLSAAISKDCMYVCLKTD